MDVIDVGLYGGKSPFGGRETPLEASLVWCDKYQVCSFYENNQCLKVRSVASTNCKFGRRTTVTGYTRRAKKYREFKSKWVGHEQYNKLNHPPKKLGLIDGCVVFPYPYVRIEEKEDGELQLHGPLMFVGDQTAFIPKEKFTPEFIHKVCSFRPQALMGGEIEDYRKEIIPKFITHLKEVMPEKYEELIDRYPGYGQKINYIGRKALLNTISPSFVVYESKQHPQLNEEWYWDGQYLNYKGGYVSKVNVTNDYEVVDIKIKPSDKSTINITSNDQVLSQTVFLD